MEHNAMLTYVETDRKHELVLAGIRFRWAHNYSRWGRSTAHVIRTICPTGWEFTTPCGHFLPKACGRY